MLLMQFNPDGTTEGYNTKETVQFLDKIGEFEFRDDAKIKISQFSQNVYGIIVSDRLGHFCSVCKIKKNEFIEIVELVSGYHKMAKICCDCLKLMKLNIEDIKS